MQRESELGRTAQGSWGAEDPKKVREGFLEEVWPKHIRKMTGVGQANGSKCYLVTEGVKRTKRRGLQPPVPGMPR